MRIDKFLRDSRLIKRRTVAQKACESDRVKINDKICKPKDRVEAGDMVEIDYGNSVRRVKVIDNGKELVNPKPDQLYIDIK